MGTGIFIRERTKGSAKKEKMIQRVVLGTKTSEKFHGIVALVNIKCRFGNKNVTDCSMTRVAVECFLQQYLQIIVGAEINCPP